MQDALLREYVRSILAEDIGTGAGGWGDWSGPYGIDFTGGDPSKLVNVFIRPFTDVIDTALGKGKEVSTRIQTLGKVTLEAIASTVLPQLSSDFKRIFAEEEKQIDRLRNQYSDVYNRTWQAIKDHDVLAAAFMYDPASMITVYVARKAPIPVLETMNILAGGKLDRFIASVKKKLELGPKQGGKSNFDIGKALTQDKVMNLIRSNPLTSRMQQDGRQLVRGTLEEVFDDVNSKAKARSLQDLVSSGRYFEAMSPSRALAGLQKLPPQQRTEMERTILHSANAATKNIAVKQLSAIVKFAVSNGVPETHPFVADYRATIKKIQTI